MPAAKVLQALGKAVGILDARGLCPSEVRSALVRAERDIRGENGSLRRQARITE